METTSFFFILEGCPRNLVQRPSSPYLGYLRQARARQVPCSGLSLLGSIVILSLLLNYNIYLIIHVTCFFLDFFKSFSSRREIQFVAKLCRLTSIDHMLKHCWVWTFSIIFFCLQNNTIHRKDITFHEAMSNSFLFF